MSINVVCISGNLTRDPEKRGKKDNPVLAFGIAVNDRVKVGDDWEDRPNFFDCVVFGNRAKSLGKILKKGMAVSIKGKLHYSTWEIEDGSKRSKVDITVEEIVLPPRPKGSDSSDEGEDW
jgi:single-strand DNA-binding protein